MPPSNKNSNTSNSAKEPNGANNNNRPLRPPPLNIDEDDTNSIVVNYDPHYNNNTAGHNNNNNSLTRAQLQLEAMDHDDLDDYPVAFCDRCFHNFDATHNRPIQAMTCGHSICAGCLDALLRKERTRLERGGAPNRQQGTDRGHLFVDCQLCRAPRAFHTKHRHINVLACASFCLIQRREKYWRRTVLGVYQNRIEELEHEVSGLQRQLGGGGVGVDKQQNLDVSMEEASPAQPQAVARMPQQQQQQEQQQQEDVAKMPPPPQRQQSKVAAKMPPPAQQKNPPLQQTVAKMPPPAQQKQPPQQKQARILPQAAHGKHPLQTAQQKQKQQQRQVQQQSQKRQNSKQQQQQQQQTANVANSSLSPRQKQTNPPPPPPQQPRIFQTRAVAHAVAAAGAEIHPKSDRQTMDDERKEHNEITAAAAAAAAAAYAALERKAAAAATVSKDSSESVCSTAAVCKRSASTTTEASATRKDKSPAAHSTNSNTIIMNGVAGHGTVAKGTATTDDETGTKMTMIASSNKPSAHPASNNHTTTVAAITTTLSRGRFPPVASHGGKQTTSHAPDTAMEEMENRTHAKQSSENQVGLPTTQQLQEKQQPSQQQVKHAANHNTESDKKPSEYICYRRKPQDDDDHLPDVASRLPGGGRYLGNPDTARQRRQPASRRVVRDFFEARDNYYLTHHVREGEEKTEIEEEKTQVEEEEEEEENTDAVGGNTKTSVASLPPNGTVAVGRAASNEKKQTQTTEAVQQQQQQQQQPNNTSKAKGRRLVWVQRDGERVRTAYLVDRVGQNASIEWTDTKKLDLVRFGCLSVRPIRGYQIESVSLNGASESTTAVTVKQPIVAAKAAAAKDEAPNDNGALEKKAADSFMPRKRARVVATVATPEEEEACKRAKSVAGSHGTCATVKNNKSIPAVTPALAPSGKSGKTTTQKEGQHQINHNSTLPDPNLKPRRGRTPKQQINGDVSLDNVLPTRSRSPKRKQQLPLAEANSAFLPPQKPKRGRPPKKQPLVPEAKAATPPVEKPESDRPPKQQHPVPAAQGNSSSAPPGEKPKRGRTPKQQQQPMPKAAANNIAAPPVAAPPVDKTKRGRPSKQQQQQQQQQLLVPKAAANNVAAPPVEKPKRGRPPKKQQSAVSDASDATDISPKRGGARQSKRATSPGKVSVLRTNHSSDSLLNQNLAEDLADPFAFPGQGVVLGSSKRRDRRGQSSVQHPTGPSKEAVTAESLTKVPPANLRTAKAPSAGKTVTWHALPPKPPRPAKKARRAKTPKKRGPGRARKISAVDNKAASIEDQKKESPSNRQQQSHQEDGEAAVPSSPPNRMLRARQPTPPPPDSDEGDEDTVDGRALGIKDSKGATRQPSPPDSDVDEDDDEDTVDGRGSEGDPWDVDKEEAQVEETPEFGGIKRDFEGGIKPDTGDRRSIQRFARGLSGWKLPTRRRPSQDEEDAGDDIYNYERFEVEEDDASSSRDEDDDDDGDEVEVLDQLPPKNVSADSLMTGNAASNADEEDSLVVSPLTDSHLLGGGTENVPERPAELVGNLEKPMHTGRYARLGEHVI